MKTELEAWRRWDYLEGQPCITTSASFLARCPSAPPSQTVPVLLAVADISDGQPASQLAGQLRYDPLDRGKYPIGRAHWMSQLMACIWGDIQIFFPGSRAIGARVASGGAFAPKAFRHTALFVLRNALWRVSNLSTSQLLIAKSFISLSATTKRGCSVTDSIA